MNIAARLDTMRQSAPGCVLIAFGDLSNRLVLRSSPAGQHPQEYLEQLCAQAEHGFRLQDALLDYGTPHTSGAAEVMVVLPQETRIYIRTPDAEPDIANDAILCVCDSESTARTLIAPAKSLLADLSGGA